MMRSQWVPWGEVAIDHTAKEDDLDVADTAPPVVLWRHHVTVPRPCGRRPARSTGPQGALHQLRQARPCQRDSQHPSQARKYLRTPTAPLWTSPALSFHSFVSFIQLSHYSGSPSITATGLALFITFFLLHY